MKTCSKCKIEKPFEGFGKHSKAKDGYLNKCKVCVNQQRRERYRTSESTRDKAKKRANKYASTRRDVYKERSAAYRKENPEQSREAVRKCHKKNGGYADTRRKWVEANSDALSARRRAYWVANKDKLREARREYYYANRTSCIARSKVNGHRRRAILANTPSDNWQASEVFESANWQCFYCGIDVVQPNRVEVGYQPNEAQADHFIPLSNGGTNERKNIVCSCGQCNFSKNSKNPFDFIRDNIN